MAKADSVPVTLFPNLKVGVSHKGKSLCTKIRKPLSLKYKLEDYHDKLKIYHDKLKIYHDKLKIYHDKLKIYHDKLEIYHDKLEDYHDKLEDYHDKFGVSYPLGNQTSFTD